MPHVVCEPCLDCKHAHCVEVCPVPGGCFFEGERMVYIHPGKCIDCEACVPKCPVDAIYHHENVPDAWKGYIEMNARMAPLCPPAAEKRAQ